MAEVIGVSRSTIYREVLADKTLIFHLENAYVLFLLLGYFFISTILVAFAT